MLEWTVERFQDALLTEELDPGLFSRQGNRPEKTAARIDAVPRPAPGSDRRAARRPPRRRAARRSSHGGSRTSISTSTSPPPRRCPPPGTAIPQLLALEQDRIFAKTWQLVGHTEQVRLPGDYFTCTVAEEPLVVTRAEDGAIHAFSNVCRHRAGPVARGAGHRKALMCGYHGWTYTLDGRLQSTPEWDGVRCFEKTQQNLPAVARRDVGPVSLRLPRSRRRRRSRRCSASIPAETSHLPLEHMSLFKKIDYEVACNWKVYVDNYLEGYHIPIVHPELFKELDYRAYKVETAAYHSKQHAPDPLEERGLALPPRTSPRARSPRRSTTGSSRT